jgi:hypothetical protein
MASLVPASLLASVLFSLTISTSAFALPVANFRVIDVYCSNPAYKPLPEEQAYRDNLKGIGCGDGKMSSPPCFEDYYQFSSRTAGVMVSVAKESPGVFCKMVTPLEISEPQPGMVQFKLGATTSHGESNRDGVSISCGSEEKKSSNIVRYYYEMKGSSLLLKVPSGPQCGTFIFEAAPVPSIPGLRR